MLNLEDQRFNLRAAAIEPRISKGRVSRGRACRPRRRLVDQCVPSLEGQTPGLSLSTHACGFTKEARVTRRFVTMVMVALIATGVSALSASAGSSNNPKADIQAGNGFCGADVAALPVVGFTNYHRTGNTVSIEYHLKNALPDSTYIVELWGDACTFFGVITTVTTNGNGVANGNGDITVPAASTRFFATAWGPTAGTTPPL
jgi:hypothetical protein